MFTISVLAHHTFCYLFCDQKRVLRPKTRYSKHAFWIFFSEKFLKSLKILEILSNFR